VGFAIGWLDVHGLTPEARFVLNPLLGRADLGGDAGRVVGFAIGWLDAYGLTQDAGFVLSPLLGRADLGGDAGRVVGFAIGWLDEHGLTADAGFVLASLLGRLDLGAFRSEVFDNARTWVQYHPQRQGVGPITKVLISAGELDVYTVRAVLAWMRRSPADEESLWRITQLKRWLQDRDIIWDILDAAESVVDATLRLPDITLVQASQIETLLTYLMFHTTGIAGTRVDDLLATWISNPFSFREGTLNENTQRPYVVRRVASLFFSGRLDVGEAKRVFGRLDQWTEDWDERYRSEAKVLLHEMEELVRNFGTSNRERSIR
jgi:hypothetical protein